MPVIWQISAIQLNKKTWISGVILKSTPFSYNRKISNFRNLLKVVKSYFIGVYANKEISVTANDKIIYTNTDKYGGFSVVINKLYKGEPEIKIAGSDKPLKILQNYPIVFQNTKSPFDVISDIDDTIIVSYTANFFKRIGTLAFISPQNRKTIGFTQTRLEEYKKHDVRVFYVSKSESNLFAMITSFIEHNNLPKGKLILTPYLKILQLFHPKKDRDYKVKNIRFLIENSGTKDFVLIGDDSQRDMEIYTVIAKEFPKRIIKIYIRQTKLKILLLKKNMLEKLKSTGVPVQYFIADTPVDALNEITQLKK